ncbi:MAG: DUF4383 domain-containing protein [Thermoanaerobaculia bacterium]
MSTVKLGWTFAVVFALIGLLGFVPNPIVGPEGIFATDLNHNLVHLISAAVFAFAASRGAATTSLVMKIFGVVYLLVGVLGLAGMAPDGNLLGLMHINDADNFLHLALGVVIGGAGFFGSKR